MQLPEWEYDQDTGAEPQPGGKRCGILNGHEAQNVLFLIPRTKPLLAESLLPLTAMLV